LVAEARAGGKDAFAELVARHRPMVLGLARRLLRDDGLAADATQEATLAALVGLDRLLYPERFGSWYAGIALNVARRWLREPAPSALPEEHPDTGAGPAERVEAAEVAARVRDAVATLAPGQRAAVLAFYWGGLTHAEAAIELGITPGAVKARLHQARSALAPRLNSVVDDQEGVRAMASAGTGWVDAEILEVRGSSRPDPPRTARGCAAGARAGRRLPIYTGAPEAIAMACSLEAVDMPRPMTYQLAASLLRAAASRVTEIRVTRLAESTFYAVVAVETPTGVAEVDARPSDALNLALVSNAPIRIEAGLLDDPEATRHTAWEHYPTRAPELAAEVRQRQADLLIVLAEEPQEPGS
jgi:RNA polymerase sigma factor (sigma-70 family)